MAVVSQEKRKLDLVRGLKLRNDSNLESISLIKQFFLSQTGSLEADPELPVEQLIIGITFNPISLVPLYLYFGFVASGSLNLPRLYFWDHILEISTTLIHPAQTDLKFLVFFFKCFVLISVDFRIVVEL